ncbi:hypothetical protein GDO78_006482, partial [Eleutherodactylus coqui]
IVLHRYRCIMSDKKAVIRNAGMSEDMQQDAVVCATQAMEKYNIEKDIAAYIKGVVSRRNVFFFYSIGPPFGARQTQGMS